MNQTATEENTITAAIVPDESRLQFLPKYFGNRMLYAENKVYSQMGAMCTEYNGGYWDFYELSNGSCFMAWQTDLTEVNVTSPNGYSAKMSPLMASIVACSFAFNSEVWAAPSEETEDTYYALLDYARALPEAEKFNAAID